MTDSPAVLESTFDADSVRRKVMLRILPLMVAVYVVSYLDRANAGYANLEMGKALGFSEVVFGWGFGLFFVGYMVLGVPGALLVEHCSARKWFSGIMLTWGLCSMGTALVKTPEHFYIARMLLGLAEAGFFPGLIVYFTHWFPQADRARALAGMAVAVPFSLAIGAPFSGVLLEQTWFGLAGWQWVFIVEGLPAVLLGAVVWLQALTDRPRDAWWLTVTERGWLESVLAAERKRAQVIGGSTLADAFREPNVWILALSIFAINTGGYALVFWLPTAVRGLLEETGQKSGPLATSAWTGLIFLCGIVGVVASGQAGRRFGGQKWQAALAVGMTGLCLAATVGLPLPWAGVFVGLCLTGFFAFFWIAPYWSLPTATLTASGAAVAVGIINMAANIAGLVGSPIVGRMKTEGFDDRAALLFFAGCYTTGGIALAFLRHGGGTSQKT